MDRSVAPVEWKPEETAGKRTQVGFPFLGVVTAPALLDAELVRSASFSGCLADAARRSGLEDQQLASKLHISAGYMSKFMRGVAQQWARRMVLFMRVTGSLGPLQWLAEQMGCELTVRNEARREADMLRARLAELERYERMAA